jgi:hypothetical protein
VIAGDDDDPARAAGRCHGNGLGQRRRQGRGTGLGRPVLDPCPVAHLARQLLQPFARPQRPGHGGPLDRVGQVADLAKAANRDGQRAAQLMQDQIDQGDRPGRHVI